MGAATRCSTWPSPISFVNPNRSILEGAYADDLAALVEKLDLKDVIHIGDSIGAGSTKTFWPLSGCDRLACPRRFFISGAPGFILVS